MNRIILFTGVILCLCASSHQQDCSPASLRKFDEVVAQIMIVGNPNLKFAENNQNLQKWCSQAAKLVEINQVYNKKCNKNLFKQLYSVYTFAFKRTLKLYCRVGSKIHSTFLEATPCFNQNKNRELKCFTNMIDRLLGAQNEIDDKKKIPHFCCSWNKWFNCMREMQNLPGCSDDKAETMISYIRSQSSQAVDIICGDWQDDSDKCAPLGEPPKKLKTQRRSKSPALAVAVLFESLPEV